MIKPHCPISPKCHHMLHGGDYNPDQWQHMPEIITEDFRLMKLANTNVMSIGIFSWTSLEPEEGRFEFGWLDDIMDRLAKNGMFAILATPTGARPAWMSQKYPEILRVNSSRVRQLHGHRHNHCYTSPIYRRKTNEINTSLAKRYKDHPALLMWHVSNEYGGDCHCDLCQEEFRKFLKKKFNNNLDALNKAYWTAFWSHTYTNWSQIESPSPIGENYIVHGLDIDWRRFTTDRTVDFMRTESIPLRKFTPGIPITTNFMGTYPILNYWKFKDVLDVVSWDSYPRWNAVSDNGRLGSDVGFVHDINRCILQKPWMLMESVPGATNWAAICKLKRPGMHLLSSLQAIAHGSDTVQYFQWRKSRGSSEKFHGAVVDHEGSANTRIFKEVAEVGKVLAKMDAIVGATTIAQTAVVYDWENRWALEDMAGLRNIPDPTMNRYSERDRCYETICKDHYKPLWDLGIATDVIDMEQSLDKYKLVIAPMLYMVRASFAEKITEFVTNGGTYIATYWSGVVDENDLVNLGGFPGPLRNVLGIWAEEIDTLLETDENSVVFRKDNSLKIKGSFKAYMYCERIHTEGAEILATYGSDFYKGEPALTRNRFGKGEAYYIASRNDDIFQKTFVDAISKQIGLTRAIESKMPKGVTARTRTNGKNEFVFIQNYSDKVQSVAIGKNQQVEIITGKKFSQKLTLNPYGIAILKRDLKYKIG